MAIALRKTRFPDEAEHEGEEDQQIGYHSTIIVKDNNELYNFSATEC